MKRILSSLFLFGLTSALAVPNAVALEGETLEELRAVQLYDQDKLIEMIDANTHLNKVVEDRCQLVQDIEARADVLKVPAYQFLWGDMLAWGVCVDAEPARGISYMEDAANQGFPAALEQLGRYYAKGTLVQQDKSRAVVYLREASSLQNLNAQIRLVELFLEGYGSPYDYEDAYHWLYNSVTDDKQKHQQIAGYLSQLEALMHPKAVRAARRPLDS
ncbi:MAG TPA: flagellar protein MotX [Alteromonas macleodii]|uniref:Flagellar protein MotX n=1 Tax=Alteromonas australica TaxID=589873 RepID=A0A358E014_9ALTE|nr:MULTISPECIES: tetratricopeptide repeat protein [Alteromonas]MDY6883979.1 tetratricopeptide repeat protein [Pseudomonadota bacterium]HCV05091.1 flagellar protein MotX [Pseudoalteromonas sp.]MEA3382298.1 tetratricopeptide repeat protein [Pseudomonadota bacterium]MEC7360275.1 tetratricopeptide repeat protein [Pseudomonadota bacterium]HBU51513.1 flagellar protein MotX [Alteromonas australica]|tara:strand:- start:3431 stop:4081 length:651 start_codon:yes stop_codon:yes gene_type:complete